MTDAATPTDPKGVPKTCLHCGTTFLAPTRATARYHFCSDPCRWAFHAAKGGLMPADDLATPSAITEAHAAGAIPMAPPSAATPALPAPRRLTPSATARIRGQIAHNISEHITLASAVIEGRIQWTPTQARVFATLLNKVVPDLSAAHVINETPKDLSNLTREELQRIIDSEVEDADDLSSIHPAPRSP